MPWETRIVGKYTDPDRVLPNNPLRLVAIALLIVGIIYPAFGQMNALQQGKRHYQSGDFQQAIEPLRSALAADSTNRQAYILLAHSYLNVENYLMADLTAEEGLRHFPETTELQWIRAEALTNREQFGEAIRVYNRLHQETAFTGRISGALSISRDQVRARLGALHQALGLQKIQQEDTTAALHQFEEALTFIPDSLQVYQNLGFLHVKRGNPERALAVADSGLARDSTHVPLLRIKAQALYAQEEYQELLETYRRLYALRPEKLDIALGYGEVLVANQQMQKAYKHYKSLLEKYPDNRKVYEALIRLNERGMNYQGKVGVLKKMRKRFPDDTSIVNRMAETYTTIREWGEARSAYDTLRMMTGDTLNTGLAIARTFERQDSLGGAEEHYRRLYDDFPENIQVLQRYGEVLEEREQWNRALEIYRQYLSRKQDGYGYRHLGWNYEQTGEDTEAEEAYLKSLEVGALHPLPLYRLARMVQSDGELDSALILGKKAIRQSLQRLAEQQRAAQKNLQALKQGGDLSGSYETRTRLENYNQLAKDVFGFLSEAFPMEMSEPVITGLLEEYPDSGRLYYLTGRYYENHAQIDQAVDHLTQAVKLSSNLTGAHLMLGEIYFARRKTEKAIQSFRRVLSLDPQNTQAYNMLLEIHEQQGTLGKLCDRWLALYRANSRNSVLREYLMEALHKAGRYDEARKIISKSG